MIILAKCRKVSLLSWTWVLATAPLSAAPLSFLAPDDAVSEQHIGVHPFAPTGFGLSNGWTIGIDNQVDQVLKGSGLDPRITVKSRFDTGFGLVGGGSVKAYDLSVNGVPLCDFELKAMSFGSSGPVVIGALPMLSGTAPAERWPEAKAVWEWLTAHTPASGAAQSEERCYFVRNQELIPAWRFTWSDDGFAYESIATDNESLRESRLGFDVAGKGRIYNANNTDSTLKDFTLNDLKGNGRLESNDFVSIVDTTRYARAYSADHNFIYTPGTSDFAQTSAFTNATRQLEWFRSIGFTNFGDMAIEIEVHGVLQGSVNNALYTPKSGAYPPSITIGDGDNLVLKNLPTDSDVVSHELGHHVVYKSITQTSGEPLVLHEALADFFTFARTGNACLGESICPKGSPIKCAIDSKCLRTADNKLAYGASDLPNEAHLRSQFISGLLWDIRTKEGIEGNEVDKIVLKAVSLLIKNSGYRDLVIALVSAEKSLTAGRYCAAILKNVQARGLTEHAADIECKDDGASVPGQTTATGTGTTAGTSTPSATTSRTSGTDTAATDSDSGSKKSGLCGVVYGAAQSPFGINALMVLILPLFAAWPRRRS